MERLIAVVAVTAAAELLVLFMELEVLAARIVAEPVTAVAAVDLAPVGLEALRPEILAVVVVVGLVFRGVRLRLTAAAAAVAGLWGPGEDPLLTLPLEELDTLRLRLISLHRPITVQAYLDP